LHFDRKRVTRKQPTTTGEKSVLSPRPTDPRGLGGRRNRGREGRRREEKARKFIRRASERNKESTAIHGGLYTHRGTGAPVDLLVSEAEPPCCVLQPLHAHVRAGYGGAARSRVPSERKARAIPSLSLAHGWLAKKREGRAA